MRGAIDFINIVREAWQDYDDSRAIKSVEDISAKVSTNHVYRIRFNEGGNIIAKLSYFGKYEDFVADHTIVNALATNLIDPFENFLSKSLTKYGKLYVYRHQDSVLDAWVVFYNTIRVGKKPARKQNHKQIAILGEELARFHKACHQVRNILPRDFKHMKDDVGHLLDILKTDTGQYEHRQHLDTIRYQCDLLVNNIDEIGLNEQDIIPVFVDWNIGNFSLTDDYRFFSRWDYDWFRMSSRVMDFYFFSRVCSEAGDRTVFSYLVDPLMEDRFLIFLKAYHSVYPLTEREIRFIKEAYRFFILNYVVKDGRYFFHEIYATKLQREAHDLYFPRLDDSFHVDKLLSALNL